MSVSITKPQVGEDLKAATIGAIIDELGSIESATSTVTNGGISNGSFETDSDADGTPDGWTLALLNGGSAGLTSTAANVAKGVSAWWATTPGGTGNGGATLTSALIPVSPGTVNYLKWFVRCTSATMTNQAEVLFYSDPSTYMSATTIWTDAATNPTTWTAKSGGFAVITGAKYIKIRLTGGVIAGGAGTAYFDDVRFIEPQDDIVEVIRSASSGGDAGQTLTAATWNTRALTTISVANKYGTFTPATDTNRLTINYPGRYEIKAFASAYNSSGSGSIFQKIRVRNITDSTTAISGFNILVPNTSEMTAHCYGTITITAPKTFELQHYSTVAVIAGMTLSTGETEVYAGLFVKRIGD